MHEKFQLEGYAVCFIHTNDNISQLNNPNLQQASCLKALATISHPVKRIITTDTFSKVCSSTCWKQRHLNKHDIEFCSQAFQISFYS